MSSADDVKSDPEPSNAPAPAVAPAEAAAPLPGAGAAAPAKNLREPQPTPLREAWKPKEGLVNLYWAPGSQPSRAVYQLMLEGNIPHRTVDINIRKRENRTDEFRYNINHHGLVPVIWDEGKFMPESVDILHHLSDKHNLDAWYPKDPAVRARVDEFLHWCPSHVRDITTGISRSIGLSKDAKLTAELKGRIPQMLNELEEKLANTNYIVTNEHPTIADLQLLHEVWGPADMGVVSFAQHPKGEAWLRRMKERPHSKKAYGSFGKLMWALKTVLNIKWFFGSKTGTL